MRLCLAVAILLASGHRILCVGVRDTGTQFHQPFVDESGWAEEPIPAESDPKLAKLLDEMNAYESWDYPPS